MTLSVQDALQRTIEHREIFPDEMLSIMRRIMSGEVTPVMIAALTVGLRVKKETIGEIASAAQVMREFATKVDVSDHRHLVDIVGTGVVEVPQDRLDLGRLLLDYGTTIRTLPLDPVPVGGVCIVCGEPATELAVWAQAY